MTEDEFDESCNFLLNGLREHRPQLAAELTKIMAAPKYRKYSKRARKVEKIRLLRQRSAEVISEIFAERNAAWAREPKSDVSNFFYMLERRADWLNPRGEITGGNYTTKV